MRFRLLIIIVIVVAVWIAVAYYHPLPLDREASLGLSVVAISLTVFLANIPKCDQVQLPSLGERFDYVSSTYERSDSYQLKLGVAPSICRFLFDRVRIGPINLEKPSEGEVSARFSGDASISLLLRKGEGYDALQRGHDFDVERQDDRYEITVKNLQKYNSGDLFQARSQVTRTKDDILRKLKWEDRTNLIEINNTWGFPVSNFAFTTLAKPHEGQKVRPVHGGQLDRIELEVSMPFADQDWSKIGAAIPLSSALFLRFIFIELAPGRTLIEFE
jgi:hypothetical protein